MSVVAVALLLVESGSGSAPLTFAEFTSWPADEGVTVIVTIALPPATRLPRLQFTGPLPLQFPCVVAVEPNATPPGNVSASCTFVAVAGPLFVTTRRYASGTPAWPGFGDAVFVNDRSALDGSMTFKLTENECDVAPDCASMLNE